MTKAMSPPMRMNFCSQSACNLSKYEADSFFKILYSSSSDGSLPADSADSVVSIIDLLNGSFLYLRVLLGWERLDSRHNLSSNLNHCIALSSRTPNVGQVCNQSLRVEDRKGQKTAK